MEKYSKEEIVEALKEIKEEYPAVYKWFFLEVLLKNDSLRNKTPAEQ